MWSKNNRVRPSGDLASLQQRNRRIRLYQRNKIVPFWVSELIDFMCRRKLLSHFVFYVSRCYRILLSIIINILSISVCYCHHLEKRKMMKCHAILTILSAWILLENTHCWSEASKGTCASADNPKKCTETVQNHLKNTVRTLWQEEIMPEQTKQLKDHFDKELAKLTNTISEIKAPLQVRIRVDT